MRCFNGSRVNILPCDDCGETGELTCTSHAMVTNGLCTLCLQQRNMVTPQMQVNGMQIRTERSARFFGNRRVS